MNKSRKFFHQTNKILGKDWLKYHPYSKITSTDNYYIGLCNQVLKIIQKPGIANCLDGIDSEKALACIFVSYFEDVISETRLFSSFTRQYKKMYGKELPFYDVTDNYYDDEINLYDLHFLIWYYISVCHSRIVIDPFFEHDAAYNDAVLEIHHLFDRAFEQAPQNENLQKFLQLSAGSDVKTVREKLTFIAYHSYLWSPIFSIFLHKIVEKYQKNGIVVLDEETEIDIYDQRVNFIFNECLPLLSMRANEYYAAILGEEHTEYQFIKNISKRIVGAFLLLKIENDGYVLEHLTSKKQIWLSNEFTAFEKFKLVENESVLSICLVEWTKDVWQNQGGCVVTKKDEMEGKDFSKHLFDDENKKKEILQKVEKAFLDISKGKQMVYVHGIREYAEFFTKLMQKHAKNIKHKITDKGLDKHFNNILEYHKKNTPFEKDEPIGLFFNVNSGIEILRERVIICMPDKTNPHYARNVFDLCNLITITVFSKEFINYAIDNHLINLSVEDYKNPDMYDIIMKNLDFLIRFYRKSAYFSKPEIEMTK